MGPCGKRWNDALECGGAEAQGVASSADFPEASLGTPLPLPAINRGDCVWYTSHYCEENVLRLYIDLAESAAATGVECYVVFVSNRARQVPLWCQVLADSENQPVLWDYHVLLLAKHPEGSWVYDLDSTLPFPTPAPEYVTQAFHGSDHMNDNYRQIFRVVPAAECLAHFASDRSHMRSRAGHYSARPPNQPPLRGERAGSANNMSEWINMDAATGRGQVMSLNAMSHFVCQLPHRYS